MMNQNSFTEMNGTSPSLLLVKESNFIAFEGGGGSKE